MARAFAYIRVSTQDQDYSPEAQEQQVRAYCVAKGLDLAHVFIETGVSGCVPMSDRRVGGEMLSRLSEVDALVFAKLDRAFRDTVDCLLTVKRLRELGKAVHFLDLGIDSTTAAGELCLTMMGALAQFERRRISDRTKEALAVARGRGVRTSPPPFGYRWAGKGVHAPDPNEFPVLQEILTWKGTRVPANEIARHLNLKGRRTREGRPWTHVQIGRILGRTEKSA